jgi:hypothetical protein
MATSSTTRDALDLTTADDGIASVSTPVSAVPTNRRACRPTPGLGGLAPASAGNFIARSAIISLLVVTGLAAGSSAIAAPVAADGVAVNAARWSPASGSVFAQAGRPERVASGTQGTDRPRSKRASSHRHRATVSSRYDGSWSGSSSGSCIGNYGWAVRIHGGTLSGGGIYGHVSSSGTVSGTVTKSGTTYRFNGHAVSSRQTSGRWTGPNGCFGNWSMSRTGG